MKNVLLEGSKELVKFTKNSNINLYMLTGDKE